jgi:Na+/melibiose symporter-like transporter
VGLEMLSYSSESRNTYSVT